MMVELQSRLNFDGMLPGKEFLNEAEHIFMRIIIINMFL